MVGFYLNAPGGNFRKSKSVFQRVSLPFIKNVEIYTPKTGAGNDIVLPARFWG
jgi:hypothetical protein